MTPREEWLEFQTFSRATQENVAHWAMRLHQTCQPKECTCARRAVELGRHRVIDIARGMPDMDRKTDALVWRRAFNIHRAANHKGPITPPWALRANIQGCSCFSRAYDEFLNGRQTVMYGVSDPLERYKEREI